LSFTEACKFVTNTKFLAKTFEFPLGIPREWVAKQFAPFTTRFISNRFRIADVLSAACCRGDAERSTQNVTL
jgi:hypothetical protein